MQPRIFVIKNFGRTTLLSRLFFVTALSFWPAVYRSYIGISSFNSLSMLEYKPINQSICRSYILLTPSARWNINQSINQLVYRSYIDIPSLRSLAETYIHIFYIYILEIQEKPPSFIELLFGRKTVVFNQSINQQKSDNQNPRNTS